MMQHFKFKPLFENAQIPGWTISFFYKQVSYKGVYHKDGKITFTGTPPHTADLPEIEKMIHGLMLFHVYD